MEPQGARPILDLDEAVGDSPMFRQKLHSEVDDLAGKLKRVTRVCKQLTASSQAFSSDFRALGAELQSIRGAQHESLSLEDGCSRFGETLELLYRFHIQMMSQMQLMLVAPIDTFLAKEVSKVKDVSKRYESLKQRYTQLLSRYSSTPKDSPKYEQVGEQLAVTRTEFMSAVMDNVISLNDFEVKKKTDLLETLAAFMFTQTTYHHQAYETLRELDPYSKMLNAEIEAVRSKAANERQHQIMKKTELSTQSIMRTATDEEYGEQWANGTSREYEGYLFSYEKSGRNRAWKRRYFILAHGRLSMFKDETSIDEASSFVDMIVSTVKATVPGLKRDHVFEVISPSTAFTLQAESQNEKEIWVKVILNAISTELARDIPQLAHAPSSQESPCIPGLGNFFSSSEERHRVSVGESRATKGSALSARPRSQSFATGSTTNGMRSVLSEDNIIARDIDLKSWEKEKEEETTSDLFDLVHSNPSNKVCADCLQKNPTWASINLCVVLCIQCSGIHRSLGTHISKVRSLTLDKWDRETKLLFKQIGNDFANAVYETDVPLEWKEKANKNISRAILEEYIRSKYVDKIFFEKVTVANAVVELHKAIRQGLVHGVYRAIARGADVNSTMSSSGQGEDTMPALHWATRSKQLAIMELLLLNGARSSEIDFQGRTALHHAARARFTPGVVLLLKRGSNVFIPDALSKTCLDYAVEQQLADIVSLIRMAQLAESEKSSATQAAFEATLATYEAAAGSVDGPLPLWSAALPTLLPPTGSPRVNSNPRRLPTSDPGKSPSVPSPPMNPWRLQESNTSPPKSSADTPQSLPPPTRPAPPLPTSNLSQLKRDMSDPALSKSNPRSKSPHGDELRMVVSPRGMQVASQLSPKSQTREIGGQLALCYECHMLVDPGKPSVIVEIRSYHVGCLHCESCRANISDKEFEFKDDKLKCNGCFVKENFVGKLSAKGSLPELPPVPHSPTLTHKPPLDEAANETSSPVLKDVKTKNIEDLEDAILDELAKLELEQARRLSTSRM